MIYIYIYIYRYIENIRMFNLIVLQLRSFYRFQNLIEMIQYNRMVVVERYKTRNGTRNELGFRTIQFQE